MQSATPQSTIIIRDEVERGRRAVLAHLSHSCLDEADKSSARYNDIWPFRTTMSSRIIAADIAVNTVVDNEIASVRLVPILN